MLHQITQPTEATVQHTYTCNMSASCNHALHSDLCVACGCDLCLLLLQVRRHVVVAVEGAELGWMREQARGRGVAFLRRVDPYIGALLCKRPEWEYLMEV